MGVTPYCSEKKRPEAAAQEITASAGRQGTDLVIEALDEFAPASTGTVSGMCLCQLTSADYIYGVAARN